MKPGMAGQFDGLVQRMFEQNLKSQHYYAGVAAASPFAANAIQAPPVYLE